MENKVPCYTRDFAGWGVIAQVEPSRVKILVEKLKAPNYTYLMQESNQNFTLIESNPLEPVPNNLQPSNLQDVPPKSKTIPFKKNHLLFIGIALLAITAITFLKLNSQNTSVTNQTGQDSDKQASNSATTDAQSNTFANLLNQNADTSETPTTDNLTSIPTTTTPTDTPTPNNDLVLSNLRIINQYPSSNDAVSLDANENIDLFTFEENKGTSAFYVAKDIKNNSPIALVNIKLQLWINGKLTDEETLKSIDPNEALTTNEFFVPQTPGDYTVEIKINPDQSIKEKSYTNNASSVNYKVINDKTPPEIMSINTIRDNSNQQTCLDFGYKDNVSEPTEMKYYDKLDYDEYSEITMDHSSETGYRRCLSGPSGENHQYFVKITDKRGNTAEDVLYFQLYAF